jgi:hypothetical protein
LDTRPRHGVRHVHRRALLLVLGQARSVPERFASRSR